MKLKNLRLLIFLLPICFLFLTFLFNDTFYALIAGMTFIFSFLIVFPKLFSSKTITFKRPKIFKPQIKHDLTSEAKEKFGVSLNNKKNIALISIATLLFISLFSYTSINLSQSIPAIRNVFLEYYVSLFLTLRQIWIYVVLLFLLSIFVSSKLKHSESGYNLSNKLKRTTILKNITLTFSSLVFGFVVSILAVFITGTIQLNFAAIELKYNPSSAGVISDKNIIKSKLSSMSSLPRIIGVKGDETNAVLTAVVDGNTTNNFYKKDVLNSIPHTFLISSDIKTSAVVLINNTLIISSIDKDTMQTISPALAHLLLTNYFKNRDLKSYPNITILNRQEYLALRQQQINQEVAAIEAEAQKWSDYLNTMEGDANSVKQQIAQDQNIVNSAASDGDTAYNNCTSAGYTDFFTGETINLYSQDQCNSVKNQFIQAGAQAQQEIGQLNSQLDYYNGQISLAQDAVNTFQNNAQAVNDEKNSTPNELGVFYDPNNIKIVLDSTSPTDINDFLETLVHENLHYQSFVSKDRVFQFTDGQSDGFWEEGLTEYFARKVIYSDLGVSTNQGYPLIVKIVAQITKKIPESQLQQIYFTKDEGGLESVLDSTYGKNFYKDTEPYFEYLTYLPDDRQVKYANDIMTRIGGQPLSASDLYSTALPSQ